VGVPTGLLDAALSEKLQLDPDVILEKAVARVPNAETVKRQQAVVRGEEASSVDPQVGAVCRSKPKNKSMNVKEPKSYPTHFQSHNTKSACFRCGKTPFHEWQQCPVREATCRKFGMKGHFQIVCRSGSRVGEVRMNQNRLQTVNETILGMIEGETTQRNPWIVEVTLSGHPIKFRIDTGAEVTVISNKEF